MIRGFVIMFHVHHALFNKTASRWHQSLAVTYTVVQKHMKAFPCKPLKHAPLWLLMDLQWVFKKSLPTGEILRLTHVARGLDSEGVLLIDIVINGFVPPSLSSSHMSLQVSSAVITMCIQRSEQISTPRDAALEFHTSDALQFA